MLATSPLFSNAQLAAMGRELRAPILKPFGNVLRMESERKVFSRRKAQHQERAQELLQQQNLMPQTAVVNSVVSILSTQPDILKLQTFQSVTAGNDSVAQLPTGVNGWCYERLWLAFSVSGGGAATDAQIASSLTNLQVQIDGDPVWNLSGAQLQMLIRHWMGQLAAITTTGSPLTAAVITPGTALGSVPMTPNLGNLLLPFSRSWFKGNLSAETASSIGSLDRKTIAIQFTQAGGGVLTACTIYAEVSPNANLGRYIAIRQYPTPVLGAGLNQLFKFLPADPNKSLAALHFQTAVMSYLSILPDGQTPLWNQTPIAVFQNMLEAYGMTMRTGDSTPYTNIQFIRRLVNSDAYNLGNPNFTIQPFFASSPAASIACMAEIVESKS